MISDSDHIHSPASRSWWESVSPAVSYHPPVVFRAQCKRHARKVYKKRKRIKRGWGYSKLSAGDTFGFLLHFGFIW